jgi:hypothetical protein
MNGPFKAGSNYVSTFVSEALKAKLQAIHKWGIGDGRYSGHPLQLSTPNAHYCKEVKNFKSCALKRHEKFNGYKKMFDCLSGRVRHSSIDFKIVLRQCVSFVNIKWRMGTQCMTLSLLSTWERLIDYSVLVL